MKKIALIFAMEAEAQPLIERLGLQPHPQFEDPRLPFRHFKGQWNETFEILLSINGKNTRHSVDQIGTEPSVLNAYLCLSRFAPDLCINAGTAGGFRKRGCEIGDVFLIDRPCCYHDHRIPLPGFEAYGRGEYSVFHDSKMAKALGLKEGGVSTGNSLDYTSVCLELIEKSGAALKDMEAASIAWVAVSLGVPFMAIKAVTDIVDGAHPAQEEFLRNLAFASRNLKFKVVEVLEYLQSHYPFEPSV